MRTGLSSWPDCLTVEGLTSARGDLPSVESNIPRQGSRLHFPSSVLPHGWKLLMLSGTFWIEVCHGFSEFSFRKVSEPFSLKSCCNSASADETAEVDVLAI